MIQTAPEKGLCKLRYYIANTSQARLGHSSVQENTLPEHDSSINLNVLK